MSVQTVPMDDAALMQEAMAPEPAKVEAPQPEQRSEAEGQPRDEHGRFVPKEQRAEPEPQAAQPNAQEPKPQEPSNDAHVPSWRLREVSEARQAAERRAEENGRQLFAMQGQFEALQRQLAELQKPKPEPVDFFQNPDAALQQRLDPLEQRFAGLQTQFTLRMSRAMAVAEHGKAAVDELDKAVEQAMASGHPEMPLLAAQMRASDDPVRVAMQWHQRTKLQQETGGDLTAYRQKILDEAFKDPAFLAKAVEAARTQAGQNNARPNVQIPPSLSRASGSGANDAGALTDADMSDASLYKFATAPGRR